MVDHENEFIVYSSFTQDFGNILIQRGELTIREYIIFKNEGDNRAYSLKFKSKEELINIRNLISSKDEVTVSMARDIIVQMLIEQHNIKNLISIYARSTYIFLYCYALRGTRIWIT